MNIKYFGAYLLQSRKKCLVAQALDSHLFIRDGLMKGWMESVFVENHCLKLTAIVLAKHRGNPIAVATAIEDLHGAYCDPTQSYGVFVRRSRRRQGIGTELVKRMHSRLKRYGYNRTPVVYAERQYREVFWAKAVGEFSYM